MLHHRTTDPARRAEHIADQLEREHEHALADMGEYPFQDWPQYWLDAYATVHAELTPEAPMTNKLDEALKPLEF